MLLGALGVRLLQKTLPGKEINRAGDGIIKAGCGSKGSLIKRKLIPAYLFTNIGMQKYNQNEFRFNGVYSRDNLPKKVKDVAYVINLDEYAGIGTHWVAFYVVNNNVTCFDRFGIEHIQKKKKKLKNLL